jgi:hypothetical protein
MLGCCEHGNTILASLKWGQIFGQLRNYYFLKRKMTPLHGICQLGRCFKIYTKTDRWTSAWDTSTQSNLLCLFPHLHLTLQDSLFVCIFGFLICSTWSCPYYLLWFDLPNTIWHRRHIVNISQPRLVSGRFVVSTVTSSFLRLPVHYLKSSKHSSLNSCSYWARR